MNYLNLEAALHCSGLASTIPSITQCSLTMLMGVFVFACIFIYLLPCKRAPETQRLKATMVISSLIFHDSGD